ncbi:NnrS family protein [bacterium]|nr:NnrS family protein [bacterium]
MNKIFNKIAADPFRLFFPLGTLMALMGVLYWPLTLTGRMHEHTPWFHKQLVLFGFLFSFVIGFLGTAVPRFTAASLLSIGEVVILFLLWTGGVLGIFYENHLWTSLLIILTLIFLITTLAKRFLTRQKNPPPTFIFIPFGFLCLFLSQLLSFSSNPQLLTLSKNLFFQGTILFLLLGVGGFLIKSILGFGAILPQNPGDKMPDISFLNKSHTLLITLASLLFLSFFIEVYLHEKVGMCLKAFIASFFCFYQIQIHKKPTSGKLTAQTLRFSLWFLVIGLWGATLAPFQYRVSFLHLGFVGGFSLSTFAVATRVILSHTGNGHLLNQKYTPFTIAVILMSIGLLARFGADFVPAGYIHHLTYGAITWAIGVIVWSIFILAKTFSYKN